MLGRKIWIGRCPSCHCHRANDFVQIAYQSDIQRIAGDPCGYFEDGFGRSYYNHCGPTRVNIRINYRNNTTGERCVPPGTTFLDLGPKASFAYYLYPC